MSWLRRSISSDSTWFKLHSYEVFPNAFDPIKSNFESLTKAKVKCMNPFWKEVYSALLECWLNVLLDHPHVYRHVPINGEPHITNNRIPVRQEWAQFKNLDIIIDSNGNFKELDLVNSDRKPFEYEYCELRRAVGDFLDIYSGGRLGANIRKPITYNLRGMEYNVYGRIVTKMKKGCSYFYSLLNTHAKKDGLVNCSIKL